MADARPRRTLRSTTKTLIALHILLAVYSVNSVLSKFAAEADFLSWQFVLLYGGVLLVLGVYAIGWQQVIKRMPLTTAYANKAATIVWGIVFGLVIFGEPVTPLMLLGALVIVAGIVLFAVEDGRVQEENERRMNAQLGGSTDVPTTGAGSLDAQAVLIPRGGAAHCGTALEAFRSGAADNPDQKAARDDKGRGGEGR